MRKRVMSGILAVVCAAMILGTGVSMAPMQEVYAAEPQDITVDVSDQQQAVAELKALLVGKKTTDTQKSKIDTILAEAYAQIGYKGEAYAVADDASYNVCQYTLPEFSAYVENAKTRINEVLNPPADDNTDEEEEEEPAPANADHFLMVGGNWVTPVANAGQTVSIVLPVVNMGKTMVTDAVVTPVLSTDTAVWPFEITSSSYSQTI